MLQKNSFFSTPLIFYGSHQDSDEEEDEIDEDEWNYSESWILTMNTNTQTNQQSKIGLIILWADLEHE